MDEIHPFSLTDDEWRAAQKAVFGLSVIRKAYPEMTIAQATALFVVAVDQPTDVKTIGGILEQNAARATATCLDLTTARRPFSKANGPGLLAERVNEDGARSFTLTPEGGKLLVRFMRSVGAL